MRNKEREIEFSNRPFVDSRSQKQVDAYREGQKVKRQARERRREREQKKLEEAAS